jgi:hypothetical protein
MPRTENEANRSAGKLTVVFSILLGFAVLSIGSPARAQAPPPQALVLEAKGVTVPYPADWSVLPQRYSNVYELVNVPADEQTTTEATARIKIAFETRLDHAEAVGRLQDIGKGMLAPAAAFLEIGGWPALQFTRVVQRPQPSQGPPFEDEQMLRVSTAVAAESQIVRLESSLPSDADAVLIDEVTQIGRGLIFETVGEPSQVQAELETLRSGAPDHSPVAPSAAPEGAPAPGLPEGESPEGEPASLEVPGGPGEEEPGFNLRVANLTQFPDSEIEVAVSSDGQNIVIGTNNRYHFSNGGGQNFAISTVGLGGPNFTGSDPSLGYGESGAFYAANIRGACRAADGAGPFGYTCTGIWISVDDGQTFALQGDAVVCPNSDPNGVVVVPNRCFPDQEHIVADRFNAAPGGDQVYSTWRNFDATDQDAAIVCSQDSGATWTAPVDVALGTAFPRIGIGQDGFVYVAYLTGGTYEINKYSSCAAGLVEQPGFPRTVANRIPVVCPFAGHDRCDQNPSSQMVAVDDTNPSHVYYSYAENTAAGNEDIIVRDSLDGGFTWPGNSPTVTRVVRANTAVASQRIMPWICTTGGDAYVTWYDRRGATPCPTPPCAADNDLTDFYAAQVGLGLDGNLVALGDFRISDVPDAWCDSGWPCGTRQAPSASEACSNQPQLAGICRDGAGNLTGRCDFSDCGGVDMNTGPPCQCPGTDICRGGGGCPKYGDYNGNACAAGRLFASWASATSPPTISPPSTNIDTFLSVALVGDVPLIQVPGDLAFAETCVGSTSSQTLEVCNTGNSNLEIFPTIVSSDAQFSVTAPSGGYPVIISPDFCFPFEVQFTPSGSGPQVSTLTLTTNDPANGTVEVTATGSGGEPDIATAIADAGAFGEVCRGDLKDLDLTISRSASRRRAWAPRTRRSRS